MNLTARLVALERRRPLAPPVLSEAQRDRIAMRLLTIAATEGRAGVIRRCAPTLGEAKAAALAEQFDAMATRAQQERQG